MARCVVPISGGLDSTTILHIAKSEGYEIHAVSFDYGQRHLDKELACAKKQVESVGVDSWKTIDIRFFKDIANTSSLTNNDIEVANAKDVLGDPQTVNYVPNRNMMMLSICAAYAESLKAETVFHGAALVDSQAGFWDGSVEFLNSINALLSLNRRDRVNVSCPLIKLSKAEIIKTALKHKAKLENTWTCYRGEERPCGKCTACSSRIQGFIDAGFKDPLIYNRVIHWKNFNVKEIE